jgi:hypothetical protein
MVNLKTITIEENKVKSPEYQQGIICGVAFDRSSPRLRGGRLAAYCAIGLSCRTSAPSI